jgi:hypothetical protein
MTNFARYLRRAGVFMVAGLAGMVFSASSALAANMLVFGDEPSNQASLTAQLVALGNTVTNTTTMPASFAGYAVVWDVHIFSALSPAEETQLKNYILAGGSVYFTGERPCCDAANTSIQNILRAVVAGGSGIQVGSLGDIGGPYAFNPAATGGISTTPNTLSVWTPSASGGMAGIAAANIFATGAGSVTVGAVYAPSNMIGGNGRAVVLMDVDYLNGDPDLAHIIANISNFLLNGAGGGPAAAHVPVPTLTTWTLIALAALLFVATLWQRRRLS